MQTQFDLPVWVHSVCGLEDRVWVSKCTVSVSVCTQYWLIMLKTLFITAPWIVGSAKTSECVCECHTYTSLIPIIIQNYKGVAPHPLSDPLNSAYGSGWEIAAEENVTSSNVTPELRDEHISHNSKHVLTHFTLQHIFYSWFIQC